jgi:hypothetical protein
MAFVIIVKDASIPNCTYIGSYSWLDHWELLKGLKAIFCRGCSEKATLEGVHVLKSEANDGVQYIVPLCNSCGKNDEIAIWSYDELVLAICPPPLIIHLP